jgi:hypothetical protein
VITGVGSVGSVRFLGLAGNVRRAFYSVSGRWSAQAFAEGLELEAATEAARHIGRR